MRKNGGTEMKRQNIFNFSWKQNIKHKYAKS